MTNLALSRSDQLAGFVAVGLFAVVLSAPRIAELSLVGAAAVVGALFVPTLGARFALLLFLLAIGLVAGNLSLKLAQDFEIDVYAAFAEIKFVTTFFILALISRAYLFTAGVYREHRIFAAYRVFIPAIAISTLIGLALGRQRESLIFGFSINAAYSIVFLSIYLIDVISLRMLALAMLAVGLLGSTMAAAMMSIVVAIKFRKHWLVSASVFCVMSMAFLYYSIEVRDKDFLNSEITDFDRYQINVYISKIIASNFQPLNYYLGWGVGRELPPMDPGDFDRISGWFLPVFTEQGIFASSTHNEYMRLYLDYGPMGLLAIGYFLYKLLPVRVFTILAFAAITNTTLFSTSNIFVLALIMADYRLRQMHSKFAAHR